MARKKKMTTYDVNEDLLRSAEVVAARTDRKVYEVFEEALKVYPGSSDPAEVGEDAAPTPAADTPEPPREGPMRGPYRD
jgi:hypothetical protein